MVACRCLRSMRSGPITSAKPALAQATVLVSDVVMKGEAPFIRYAFQQMKYLVGIFFTAFCIAASASPIDCKHIGINSVVVSMDVPHPLQAIVYRPMEKLCGYNTKIWTHIHRYRTLETLKPGKLIRLLLELFSERESQ